VEPGQELGGAVACNSTCPHATARTAVESSSALPSLSRYPAAPACIPSPTSSGVSKVVKSKMRGPGAGSFRIRSVTSIPSNNGMRISIRMTEGTLALRELCCDQSVLGLPDHFHVFCIFQEHTQPFAHQALIIGNQDTDLLCAPASFPLRAAFSLDGSNGSESLTRKPRLSVGPASIWPPRAAARSRIPCSP
jgi:hypothetical protein